MVNAKFVLPDPIQLGNHKQLANNALSMLLAMKDIRLRLKKGIGEQLKSQSIFINVLMLSHVKEDLEKIYLQ